MTTGGGKCVHIGDAGSVCGKSRSNHAPQASSAGRRTVSPQCACRLPARLVLTARTVRACPMTIGPLASRSFSLGLSRRPYWCRSCVPRRLGPARRYRNSSTSTLTIPAPSRDAPRHAPPADRGAGSTASRARARGRTRSTRQASSADCSRVRSKRIQGTSSGRIWTRSCRQKPGTSRSIRPGSAKEILVGTNCGLARSVDFGVTWEFINPSSAGGPALSVWAVAALRGGRTYACGESGLMRSPDGRTGWVTLPDPSGTTTPYRYCSIAADSDFPDAVFVVFSRTTFFDRIFDIRNSTYFASFDGGNTWVAMPHPDAPDPQKRVPMVTTNRRSYGLDVWVGAGNLWRIPCTPIICPVTVRSLWRGTFSDGQGDRQKAHGDTGNVLFAPARSMDACPLFYSSDGGVYFNQNHNSRVTDCHDPVFLSANVGLHAQLLLGMAGAHRPGSQGEDVYMALQDDGLFATRHAGAPNRMWNHGGTADVFDVVADDKIGR